MLQVDWAWANACVLLWVRLGVLLGMSPLASVAKAPTVLWVLLTLALSGLLCAGLGLRSPMPTNLGLWVLQVLSEAGLGGLLGLSLHAAFAAWNMAGRLLDMQLGLGMGAVFDPVSGTHAPVMGVALSMLGMALFLAAEGPHALLRGVAYSAQVVAPGGVWQLPDASQLLRPVAALFTAALVVMAPVMLMLLLLELVLAVASRVLPQMNVLFVGMPAKSLVGLLVVAVSVPVMGPAMVRSYASVFQFWAQVLP